MHKNVSDFWKKQHRNDILVMFVILVLPFALSLHLLIDDTDYISSLDIFGYQFDHAYKNNRVFVWAILVRLIPLFLLTIWFFQSKSPYVILFSISPFFLSFIDVFFISPTTIFFKIICELLLLIFLIHMKFRRMKQRNSSKIVNLLVFNQNFKAKYLVILKYLDSLILDIGKNRNNLVRRLYQTKSILETETLSFSKLKEERPLKPVIQTTFGIILIIIPMLYYSYQLLPKDEKGINMGFNYISSHGFNDVRTFIWYLNVKTCALVPICIWFVSSNKWWRYAILSPIVLYVYQLWEAFEDTNALVDQWEYISVAPIILILVAFLLFISNIVKYQFKILDLYDQVSNMTEELIKKVKNSGVSYEKEKSELKALKVNISESNAEERLYVLLKLKNELKIKLDEIYKVT